MLVLVVLAWVFGAGSMALFAIFLWTGSLPILDLGLSKTSLVLWNTGLCLVFFLQHSIMIRRSLRRSLERFVPEYCYGAVYTIFSGMALLAVLGLWQASATNVYELHGAARVTMRVLWLLSFVGFSWGIVSLERFDAFGIEALVAHVRGKPVPTMPFTVKGPYRYLRHPFYAFSIVALWAIPSLSLDRLLFNGLFTGWIIVGAALEERDLLVQFGEDYARYRREVPMFVPRPWRRTEAAKKANAATRGTAA